MKEKNNLEKFIKKSSNTFLGLSIFLLITISLVQINGYLNNVLALLSALLTYALLIGIETRDKDKDDFPLIFFKIILPTFTTAFCAWVILNVVTSLTEGRTIWILVWLILMIYPSYKFWFRR